ncbi:ribosomal RNA processing protein [Mitosporidium daphniae]|uniref:DEAD-domain-containing protein n=1 Tax=Mitosporidium daphniae TaxID=1485682 RepID=A0A098VWY6_9MICR|nr:uncharacterized protein DI09_194p40 [Mitosporidium daphniae]KGG52276.1 hypothetical protein DI09_194p40 [Mitosporidium daphniae]|eukprot:XP_013238712.1 uncharacterized protein DI09_194p40 [Mitosporidium daphniae]
MPEEFQSSDSPDSPPPAGKSFSELGLCPVLCETANNLGFTTPTPIQAEAIPYALQGRDVIGLAQTGSGKTAAFALPIIQALLESPQPFFAAVLAPTRELAIQIAESFEKLGASIELKTCIIVGGVEMMAQAIALAKKPHIIIATPGRLVDHIENTRGFSLKKLRFFVLDEADRLLNMDFGLDIDKILKVIPQKRQTFLFSATMTSKVAKLQRASLVDPVRVEVATKYSTVSTLHQHYLFLPAKYKETFLVYLLNDISATSTIIFTSTCHTTQRLALMLRNLGFSAIPLHGQLPQPKRLGALSQFKGGARSILLATDVASRGLDIPSVDMVINYDIPTHSKDYIHRVGRTARAGRSGKSITMVTQYDIELYQRIEVLLGKKLDEFPIDKHSAMSLHERVSEAIRLAVNTLKEQDLAKKERKLDSRPKRGGPSRKKLSAPRDDADIGE